MWIYNLVSIKVAISMLNFKVYWSILGTYFILVRASTCLVFWIESSKSFEKSLVATLSVWFPRSRQPDSKFWFGGNLFCIKLLSRVTHISRICWGLMLDSLQPQCVRYNGSTTCTLLSLYSGLCYTWKDNQDDRTGTVGKAKANITITITKRIRRRGHRR